MAFLNLYILYLLITEKGSVDKKALFLYFICIMSLAINNLLGLITPILQTEIRLAIFILVFNVIGPIFKSSTIDEFKRTLFNFTSYSFPIAFAINLFYIFSFRNFSLKGVSGIHESPNLLGVIAALSSIWFVIYFYKTNNVTRKIICGLLFILTIPILLLSASRAAILCLVICLLIIFYTKQKMKIVFLLSFFLLLSIVKNNVNKYIEPYSKVLMNKVETRNNSGDITAGRAFMYQDNYKDFLINPIFGVGFYNIVNKENSKINDDGSLEYPSGWFFILSTTGLLGFLYFVDLIFKYLKNVPKVKRLSHENFEVFLLISFFFIHFNFEGYVFSAGGLLFFLFWVTVSKFKSIF